MIITISGLPGSGKSTVAKALAKRLKLTHHSVGGMMRDLAKERGVTLEALSREAERDGGSIDRELDERTQDLGKTGGEFVIDSRLAWHFIPSSVKILLTIDPAVAAERILKDRKAGKRAEEENAPTIDAVKKANEKRVASENKRYQEYYGVSYTDPANYDLIIDTSKLSVDEIVKDIVEFLKKHHDREARR